MNSAQQVTIVGGGVVGLSTAWELARRGLQVTVLERGDIGRATSWAGAGILPPCNRDSATDPMDQLRGLSHELFPRWTSELQALTGIDSGYRKCGGWYLADTPGERASLLGMMGYWQELGIDCDQVAPDQLAKREPALATWADDRREVSAWWLPDEAQLRSPRYLRALRQACDVAGVRIREHTEVCDIFCANAQASLVVEGSSVTSDHIVLCGGPWTGQIARTIGLELSVVPIRGQILLLKADHPVVRSIVNLGQRYVICREDGYTLIGSCEEETGFQLGTTPEMLEDLYKFAVSLIPSLRLADRIDAWSGLRPMTMDGIPMIGRVPQTNNLYVAAGHFRSGLHLSTGTAVVLAELICGENPSVDLSAFRIGKQQSSPQSTSSIP